MWWSHSVSEEWLEARREVLTATEIKDLVKECGRCKKAGQKVSSACLALVAEKLSSGELDTNSPNMAAARGHIMEPYAIEEFTNQTGIKMYHWDDCVIGDAQIGFSPDGMDIPQDVNVPYLDSTLVDSARSIVEVKSYAIKTHMAAVMADKKDLEERFQVAVAFKVLPNLESAYIIFFCPQLTKFAFRAVKYTREDLVKELETIDEVVKLYERSKDEYLIHSDTSTEPLLRNEKEIHKEFIETCGIEFNPVSPKLGFGGE